MEKTLITEFFDNEIANYREPQRQGTPRGEPIGFSLAKFKATLFALANNDLKEVAKIIGVSYGLLRKWRVEKEFKKVVERHADKFTVIFFRHLVDLNDESERNKNEFLKKPLEEIASSQPPDTSLDFSRLIDYLGYSDVLREKIGKVANKILIGAVDFVEKKGIVQNQDEFVPLALAIASFILDLNRFLSSKDKIRKSDAQIREEWESLRLANKALAKMIRNIILKPKITLEDKKQVLYMLSILDR